MGLWGEWGEYTPPEAPVHLYLDDLRHPPDTRPGWRGWWDWLWGHKSRWTVVRTSKDAIWLLRTRRVDLVSFDHDLGGNDTGYLVALHIEAEAVYGRARPPQWYIHSANPVGAARIEAAMQAAHRLWRKQAAV